MLLEIKVTVFMPMIMVTGISCRLTGVSGTMLNASRSLSYTHTHTLVGSVVHGYKWLQLSLTSEATGLLQQVT